MKIAGVFPGQGSQFVGMGKSFFDGSRVAQELFKIADEILEFKLSDLCFNGPLDELTLTKNVQPALLTVEVIAHRLYDSPLSAVAGHSLGEYSALVAAGVLTFEDALILVRKRGIYMQEAVSPGMGKMAAIMGPTPEEVQLLCDKVTKGVVEIANLNSPGQTVVAGDVLGVDCFSELAAEQGAKVIGLNVSAPFHCSLMASARERLGRDLDRVVFNNPHIPVYANFSAERISSGDEARELLKKQVCGTVRWFDLVNNMISQQQIEKVVELGPGGVLSRLMKRIDKKIPSSEFGELGQAGAQVANV